MASLPFAAITEAVEARLSSDLSEHVMYAGGQVPDGVQKYVAIQQPGSIPNETKTSRGRTVTLSLKCHVQGPPGEINPLDAQRLADKVEGSIQGAALDLGADHAKLYLSNPQHQENPNTAVGSSAQGHDVILLYDLKTQDLTE